MNFAICLCTYVCAYIHTVYHGIEIFSLSFTIVILMMQHFIWTVFFLVFGWWNYIWFLIVNWLGKCWKLRDLPNPLESFDYNSPKMNSIKFRTRYYSVIMLLIPGYLIMDIAMTLRYDLLTFVFLAFCIWFWLNMCLTWLNRDGKVVLHIFSVVIQDY